MLNNWEARVKEMFDPESKHSILNNPPERQAMLLNRYFRQVLRFELGENKNLLISAMAPAANLDIFMEGRSDEFIKGYNTAFNKAKSIDQIY